MKKTYLSPAIDLMGAESEELLVVASFEEKLDSTTTIDTNDMLTRRRDVSIWDEDEE